MNEEKCANYHFLVARVVGYLVLYCWDGSRLDMSSLTITAKESLPKESQMESYQMRQYTAISEHSLVKGTPQAIREWLTLSAGVSHANHLALQESNLEQMTRGICGLQQLTPYAQLDLHSASLKTYQACLIPGISSEFYATLPKAGIASDGVVYQRLSWEQNINETDYGLWPTPNTMDSLPPKSPAALHREATVTRPGRRQPSNLRDAVSNAAMWPTPTRGDYRSPNLNPAKNGQAEPASGHALPAKVGGQLNPTWVEWLMGWPLGWTDLKPLAMDKFQSWLQQHGDY